MNVKKKVSFTHRDVEGLCLPTSSDVAGMNYEIEWVVDGIIAKYANHLFYAAGGTGKSYCMLTIATAVANGEEIFGLKVEQMPVLYIDFENPVSVVADRIRKIGGSNNLLVWHLDNNPPPYHFDDDDKWEIYKEFEPGLIIVDSLRSSHHLDENSSKDIGLLMERLKFIRGAASTIVLIHNENKAGGYRGSTSLSDLVDQVLCYDCVERIGDNKEVDLEKTKSTIRRLGIGGKHRFDTPIIQNPIYVTLNKNGVPVRIEIQDQETCIEIHGYLSEQKEPVNQGQLIEIIKKITGFKKGKALEIIYSGEGTFWTECRAEKNNAIVYIPVGGVQLYGSKNG